MEVSDAIAKRKSVRAYEDRPVHADVLKKIVEAGQWAPNAGPFQISVIQNTGLRQRINNRALETKEDLYDAYTRFKKTSPIVVTIDRGGSELKLTYRVKKVTPPKAAP